MRCNGTAANRSLAVFSMTTDMWSRLPPGSRHDDHTVWGRPHRPTQPHGRRPVRDPRGRPQSTHTMIPMTVAFVTGLLTVFKVLPETAMPDPFEWVGELVTMVIALVVVLATGLAIHIALHGPIFTPVPLDPMPSYFVVPPWLMPTT